MCYYGDVSYLSVNGIEIYKFKADNKPPTNSIKSTNSISYNLPPTRSISAKLAAVESREDYFQRNVYHFSVNYNKIDKFDILNIHMYLMVKNNIK